MDAPDAPADTIAAAYAAMDEAAAVIAPESVTRVGSAHGRTTWAVGDIRVTLPTLTPEAPPWIIARYFARIHADATGTCALCGAVVTLTADPEHTARAWATMLPVRLHVPHAAGCAALFEDDEAGWFDPAAWARP